MYRGCSAGKGCLIDLFFFEIAVLLIRDSPSMGCLSLHQIISPDYLKLLFFLQWCLSEWMSLDPGNPAITVPLLHCTWLLASPLSSWFFEFFGFLVGHSSILLYLVNLELLFPLNIVEGCETFWLI